MAGVAGYRSSVTFGVFLAVALGALLYCRHFADDAPGLTLYVEAARCMLNGPPLQACDESFTYPPIFAFLTIPLVPFPRVLQNLAWYALTFGSLVGCYALSARLVQRLAPAGWSQRDLAWLYGIGILLSVKFALAAIGNQSYDAFVVFLVLAGLAGLMDEKPGRSAHRSATWAGLSLAGAAALKATPLLFLPYLVIKRHYRAAAVMAIAFAALSILPDLAFTVGRKTAESNYWLAWLQQVAAPALTEKLDGNPHTFWFATNPNNNSLRGLVGILYDDHSDPAHFKTAMYLVYVAYCAIVGLVILRDGRAALAIDGALLLLSMLLLSPMSSQSHYVAMIPAIFAAAAIWRRGDPPMRWVAGLMLVATFVLTNATSKDLVGAAITFWAKEHRLLVSDALLFVAFFAVLVLRPGLAHEKARMPSAIGQTAS